MAVLFITTLATVASATVRSSATFQGDAWIGTWLSCLMPGSEARRPSPSAAPLRGVRNQTHRQLVRVSLGGSRVRVTLSNAYGKEPLLIGAATIGRVVNGRLDPAKIYPITFSGGRSIIVPPGAPAMSDPVELALPDGGEAAVSLFLPNPTPPESYARNMHWLDLEELALGKMPESSISTEGDFTQEEMLPGEVPISRLFLTRIDVLQPKAEGAIVVLGSSRTVGLGRWPDVLAKRLRGRLAVVNASMVANPLTRPYPNGGEAALARLDRDVLMVPGARYLIIADAINDIAQPGATAGASTVPASELPTVDSLGAAYGQIVERAHARGIKVFAATLYSFGGKPYSTDFFDDTKERLRQDLNQWIRTSGIFDGVIDMSAVLDDPTHPDHFKHGLMDVRPGPSFTTAEGEQRLANAIDLKLFR